MFAPGAETPAGPPMVKFVGKTEVEKAPDLFLRACLQLTKITRGFRVQMLGSKHWNRFEMDDYQRELQRLVEQLEQVGISVRRPGHIGRPNLAAELRKASIHVVPSRWDEPCGLVTQEGMATGQATVASPTGGTPEIVTDAGLLFERDDTAELASQLEKLVLDEVTRRDFA